MKTLSLWFLVFMIFSACTEEIIDNEAPVADFETEDLIYRFRVSCQASDLDGDGLSYSWYAEEDEIQFYSSNSATTFFNIPPANADHTVTIGVKVSDGHTTTTKEKQILIPALSLEREWFLGRSPAEFVSNDVNYTWYYDQANSGDFSTVNCGPASVTMAVKWALPAFSLTPEDARNAYRPEGGWWYTSDIISYLNDNGVANTVVWYENNSSVTSQIDEGNIVILCLDMYYLTMEEYNKGHVDKFYETDGAGWGHFIVVKGYTTCDNQLWFEVYDPYSFNRQYSDGTLKGINRYYRADEVEASCDIWWDNAIVVSKSQAVPFSGKIRKDFPHQFGR